MLDTIGQSAKEASYVLGSCTTEQKNAVLARLAQKLHEQTNQILAANALDLQVAQAENKDIAFCDRLRLTEARISDLVSSIHKIIQLPDPIGEILEEKQTPQGLSLQRHRVPLGVIGAIYESRPNVTIDIAALCLKTGNAVILRGGKETQYTNKILISIIQETLVTLGLPVNAVQSINSPDRKYVVELLKLDKYVDMIIPRGGIGLHRLCQKESTIPVITGGIGVCHIFIDESADLDRALSILINAKTQRPSTCNTAETLLVHEKIALLFWPKLSQAMADKRVTLHADSHSYPYLKSGPAKVSPLQEPALYQEWLSLDLNVVVVKDINMAITHIRRYGSRHSEAILTQSKVNADSFIKQLDAAAIYVNASTRFTDGEQFGLGAEVAVSTQKLHARGPMGLDALTTYKWIGVGNYLCRA